MTQLWRNANWQMARSGMLGVAVVLLLTLAGCKLHLNSLFESSSYLIAVTLLSLRGNFGVSAAISILAFLCLDYLFVPPLYSFRVDDPGDTLALLSFLVTALVITRLVSRVRAEAREARLQRSRMEQLHHLFQQLLAQEPTAFAGAAVLRPFLGVFGVTSVSYFNAETAEMNSVGISRHDLPQKTRDAFVMATDFDDDDNGIGVRRLTVAGEVDGAIGFEGLQEGVLTIGPLTALMATFLERMHAFRVASEAAAAGQAETYRSAILDALAHEFKTPLATILAAAGGLREAGPLVNQQLEMTDTVENEATRLGSLTSRLLRTARLDRENIRPHLELTDVAFLVSRIARQYSARSADRHIVFKGGDEHREVMADPELLSLSMSQLIENACKYSPAGATVTIETDEQSDFMAVRVSNDRSQIPACERRHVFERFYRGADAKRSTSGSGLGLYVARKIALAHGGALELETDGVESDGVTFCLKIPKMKGDFTHVTAAQ